MTKMKFLILVGSNDYQIRKTLKLVLAHSGYRIVESTTGKETIRLVTSVKPELIILDFDSSDIKNSEVIAEIRERHTKTPIIVITADDYDDTLVLAAFKAGADDYIVKPFNTSIAAAKINASLRRALIQEIQATKLELGEIVMDFLRHEVRIRNKLISLSPKEFQLLAYLMQNKGKMLTHTQILNKVWGPSHTYDTQYLRVYIGQLRKKIDLDRELPSYIITEAGIGYRMEVA